ncbi:DgyrCDS1012 [Dimorphilus gyrociliatus]|uniref:inositol-phosphate phosphatase n=1 Tax=Dimorphilus gyrociliatus TaxID=2664684 RepID=A0A7I8V670_9ANNE|nr:DgyrCDS1012 [Dimorphilus gyrociliatus]
MKDYAGKIFLAENVEISLVDTIVNRFKEKAVNIDDEQKDEILGGKNDERSTLFIVLSDSYNCGQTITSYYTSLFRHFSSNSKSNRTLLSHDDQLVVLQLCLFESQKEENKESEISFNELKDLHEQFLSKKLYERDVGSLSNVLVEKYTKYLQRCNMFDAIDLYKSVKELLNSSPVNLYLKEKCFFFIGKPSNCVELEMLKELMKLLKCFNLSVEVPLNASFCEEALSEINIITSRCKTDAINFTNDSTSQNSLSNSELYTEEALMAYLELTVNTRNELALARAINVPEREFDQKAFTVLKHRSEEMSLYQTAVSYVMKTRLGGKSYAPDENDPLSHYLKALGDFTDFIHKLHSIVEDEKNSRKAIKSVVNAIKKAILKCKDCKVKKDKVASTCERTIAKIERVDISNSNKKELETCNYEGVEAMTIIQRILDDYASRCSSSLKKIIQGESSRKTPLPMCSVIYKFQSPEEKESESVDEKLATVTEVKESPIKFQKSKCKSFLDWALPDSLDLKNVPKPITPPKKKIVQKDQNKAQKKSVHVNLNSLYTNDLEADKENLEPNSSPCAKKPKKKTAKRNIANSLNATDNKKKKDQKRFKFCGDLDCPDWVLAEISTLSRLSSIKVKLLCAQIVNDLLGGAIDFEKVGKLTQDAKFEEDDIKATISTVNFIISHAVRYNVDTKVLVDELQQLGLPKVPYLERIDWRADILLASSRTEVINTPCLQLNLKLRENGRLQSIPVSLTEEKLNILLHELKEAQKINLIDISPKEKYFHVYPVSRRHTDSATPTMASVNVKLNPFGITLIIGLILLLFVYKFGFFSFSKPDTVDMRELMSVSIDLAEKGGNRILAVKNNDKEAVVKGKTKEGAKEYKTKADLSSHEVITGGFKKVYGDTLTVKSEEKSDVDEKIQPITSSIDLANKDIFQQLSENNIRVAKSDITIWVDPLDATQEYTEDLNQYVSTMICIAIRGVPEFGVIHFPYATENKRTFWGYAKGGKVSSNLKKDAQPSSPDWKFIISRSHSGSKVKEILSEAFGKDVKIEAAGGAGYKTIQVLTGGATAYVHYTKIKKWDICAGNAIVNAMGGKMTTTKNDKINYSASGSNENNEGLLAYLSKGDTILSKLAGKDVNNAKN